MKILTVANEKGGVGKTFIATQFAMYCALKFKLRTGLIDLDQQGNSSKYLASSHRAVASQFKAADLLLQASLELPQINDGFVYFEADDRLSLLEKQGDQAHGVFVDNLNYSLKSLEKSLDLVIIDTNPNPDIRSSAGLLVCTHLISPIQLTKEPIDGIAALFKRIESISNLNPNLPKGFLGMLPNLVESGNFQVQNGKQLIEKFGKLLLEINEIKPVFVKDERGNITPKFDENKNVVFSNVLTYGAIRRHAGIAEAQAKGLPIWEMENQKAAWSEMKRCFFAILEKMQIDRADNTTADMNALLDECRNLYGTSWKSMIRQFWMMDNVAFLSGLTPEKIRLLRKIKECTPLAKIY